MVNQVSGCLLVMSLGYCCTDIKHKPRNFSANCTSPRHLNDGESELVFLLRALRHAPLAPPRILAPPSKANETLQSGEVHSPAANHPLLQRLRPHPHTGRQAKHATYIIYQYIYFLRIDKITYREGCDRKTRARRKGTRTQALTAELAIRLAAKVVCASMRVRVRVAPPMHEVPPLPPPGSHGRSCRTTDDHTYQQVKKKNSHIQLRSVTNRLRLSRRRFGRRCCFGGERWSL